MLFRSPNKTQWSTLFWILGAAVVFGLLVDGIPGVSSSPKIGFIGAVFASVAMCAYGGYEFKWKEALIESAVLVVVCWAAFVYGLGLPFRLFPWS